MEFSARRTTRAGSVIPPAPSHDLSCSVIPPPPSHDLSRSVIPPPPPLHGDASLPE
ncbi:MAG TPA: hypothetical protein VED20_12560 [Streptosporangiaceae bacterium]|nr:hypothetical protein [Streptosporangiaceae bacterium]